MHSYRRLSMDLVNSNCNPLLASTLVAAQQIYWCNFEVYNCALTELKGKRARVWVWSAAGHEGAYLLRDESQLSCD